MNNRKVIFKEYTMKQPQLLPPSLEELIPGDHLAQVINRVIEQIEIRPLLEKHKGGGTKQLSPTDVAESDRVCAQWGILSIAHNLRKLAAQ